MTPLQLRDALFAEWSAARAEANMAYDAWCDGASVGSRTEAYTVYRAAEDRADAAEVALARSADSMAFAVAA